MKLTGIILQSEIVEKTMQATLILAAWNFIADSLKQIIVWLIVMFTVIICDLVAGCRKSLLMNEKVRFSKAWRRTMGKAVTYFSFVVMVVVINQATNGDYNIDKWAILFICGIEGSSIISNILRPKGYDFNMIQIISILAKKIFKVEGDETKKIITKINKDNEDGKCK